MKKVFAWLVISFMAVAMLQIPFNRAVNIANANEELNSATFIAVRLVPVNFDRDGQQLEGTLFPWQRSGETVWGREGYGMPDSLLAMENENNIPALLPNTQAEPLYWAKFYLEVISDGGNLDLKSLGMRYTMIVVNSGLIQMGTSMIVGITSQLIQQT